MAAQDGSNKLRERKTQMRGGKGSQEGGRKSIRPSRRGSVSFLPHGSGNRVTNSIDNIEYIDKLVALAASIETLLSE